MAYRWLYKSWTVFWTILGVTALTALILGVVGFGVLQLPVTKNYIADKVEERFNSQHEGVLTFGEFNGVLPFNFQVNDLNLYADSSSFEPVFSADSVSASLDVLRLLRSRFVITGLSVNSPKLVIDSGSEKSFQTAVRRITSDDTSSDSTSLNTPFVEILAPSVSVQNGSVKLKGLSAAEYDSLTFEEINLDMFLDYNLEERYIDIERLTMNIPEFELQEVSLFGQVYNDGRYLEFNAFNIRTGNSSIRFRGQADGVDVLEQDLKTQLTNAELDLRIDELVAEPKLVKRIYSDYPVEQQELYLNVTAKGNVDSLGIDRLQMALGESAFDADGYINKPLDKEALTYDLKLFNILIQEEELNLISTDLTDEQKEFLTQAQYTLDLSGDVDEIATQLELTSQRGSLTFNGQFGMSESLPLEAMIQMDSLNLGNLLSKRLTQSEFNGSVAFNSSSLSDLRFSDGSANVNLQNSSFNGLSFDSIMVKGNWADGLVAPSFQLVSPESQLTGRGTVNIQDSIPSVEFTGRSNNLDLKALTQIDALAPSVIDVEYELFLNGTDRDNIYGQLSADIPFSVVNGDTLPAHQFYADFTEPDAGDRRLRITSTAFDVTLDGTFEPGDMLALAPYWRDFLNDRINEEILFNELNSTAQEIPLVSDQNFTVDFAMKNVGLLRTYFPEVPAFNSRIRLSSNINANADRILFNATVQDPSFKFTDISADTIHLQVTGSFRHQRTLKEFSGLQVQGRIGSFETELISGKGLQLTFDMDEDSISIQQTIDRIDAETSFELQGTAALSDSNIVMSINDFELGSQVYSWQNEMTPQLIYNNANNLEFRDFTFINQDEFISFEGVFSEEPEDSVNYVIRSVDLSRISQLINGRIDFSGLLDGQFTTRTLTRIPTIQGELSVSGFALDNNVVGDVNVNSVFNQDLNRFDTEITIATDSTKYPDYFIRNQRVGQDISLNGYVLAPVNGEFPAVDSLYSFELDFENIDLWVIPFIAPKVFSEMSGKASGTGYVWGNTETYDFSVDYQVGLDDAVYMRPRFLDTYYYAQGDITFSRSNGLDFKDLFVIDPSGGSAILSGTYDLNDFQPTHLIDLTLEMDEFQFLNSQFEPTIPFFGKAYGSSTIRLTGTNFSPVLSTETPVYISDFSNIGIPLLEETEFDEDNKFIRFVESFDLSRQNSNGNNTGGGFQNQAERDPGDLTFNERFTLDLQFIANNPMTVQLIFDPVTGDIIRADGTGRLRIRLQDEELTMFGQFDISGGSYQFVSGDIFTRRFELESGGTITWEGEPDNARLNLNAIYQARPDINTLNQSRSQIDTEASLRVPVELVLNIGGSLSSIENDFFFRLPNTFETRQNSTLSAQIRALNRNEDEKLIQATSFLLMGDFIPSATASTDATNSLTSNFSGSGAVLNPLLSSQVISPLLSRQINSLLRSDIGSLDIDFNLNTYNNVDLAVALRLYNDRIILSREGQITGSQSNIGDLGATYRINQTLSVTAFHRQDPTFSNFNSTEESQQGQDINGLGIEAEMSFNTWQEFFRKLTHPFKRLFGIKNEQEELTQNENPPS